MTVIPFAGELPEADRPIDLKDAGLSQREALLSVCDDAKLWRSPDGETFATIEVRGHREHHATSSRAFRDWALGEVARRYSSNGRPASVSENAVRDARQSLEARAFTDGVKHQAPLRVTEHAGRIYVDLGSDDWQGVEIGADGWRTTTAMPVPIVRSRRTGAMSDPEGADGWTALRKLLRRFTDDDFILFVSWCLGALWPSGPYPILILGGEQGSGKSTLARLAQRIVDPVAGDLLQPPGDDRDLIAAARHGRVLAFDNISSVKPDLADSICRLATGAEIGGRALFTNHDTASFSACRPLLLNGIPDLAARGDLADRSIVVRLPQLDGRQTERHLWAEAEQALPAITAALFDAMVIGLGRLDGIPTPNLRMADFGRLIVAAEPALPWSSGAFLRAYAANRAEAVSAIVDGDLVASKVTEFIDANGPWDGLKSALFKLLNADVPIEARRSGDWPSNARWFSDRLTRVAPALRATGVQVAAGRRSSAGMMLSIRRVGTLAASDARPQANGHKPSSASAASVAGHQVSGSSGLSDDDRAFLDEMGGGRQ